MRASRIKFRQIPRVVFISSVSGLLSGTAAAVFLVLLDLATSFRETHRTLIWFLPLGGFLIGCLYHHFGKDIARGHNLFLDEIHDPKEVTPFRVTPFIFLSTIATHLFGGSAGREGTAVQMGASLSDQISKFINLQKNERKILLVAGTGAGFGAAIGAPWAGALFGMEVLSMGRFRIFAAAECIIASFVAHYTTRLLGASHSVYPSFLHPDLSIHTILWATFAGILFGLAARLFISVTHFIEYFFAKTISYPPFKPFLAGLLLIGLYSWDGTFRYTGLGIQTIQEAMVQISNFKDPLLKGIFTALTVGSGFKGGEFVPLVFIGATLGSALTAIIPLSTQLLAQLGFAATYAGAANTPIACTVMAIELFGYRITPFALVACFASYYFSGSTGIYKAQRINSKKPSLGSKTIALWKHMRRKKT